MLVSMYSALIMLRTNNSTSIRQYYSAVISISDGARVIGKNSIMCSCVFLFVDVSTINDNMFISSSSSSSSSSSTRLPLLRLRLPARQRGRLRRLPEEAINYVIDNTRNRS